MRNQKRSSNLKFAELPCKTRVSCPWSMVMLTDFEKIFSYFVRWRTSVRRVAKYGKRFQKTYASSIGQLNILLTSAPTYQTPRLGVR